MKRHPTFNTQIRHITIDPDRFGRLQPTIMFDTISYRGEYFTSARLDACEDIVKYDYACGDLIDVEIIGGIPRIGWLLRKSDADDRFSGVIGYDYCHHCQKRLVYHNGNRYCQSTEECPRTAFARLSYAVQPNVLNLPLGKEDLNYIIWGGELAMNLPSLLFLDSTQFDTRFYHRDESEVIVSALRLRLDQLFGHGFPRYIQLQAQDKVLDALSLTGLYNKDRQRLCELLEDSRWAWNDLPSVLTDTRFLRSCGIASQDARTISRGAEGRITELDALSREF